MNCPTCNSAAYTTMGTLSDKLRIRCQDCGSDYSIDSPSIDTLKDWDNDAGCEALDGCWVEPDGACEHGHPSWLRALGMI